jgi:hypothetical protein
MSCDILANYNTRLNLSIHHTYLTPKFITGSLFVVGEGIVKKKYNAMQMQFRKFSTFKI